MRVLGGQARCEESTAFRDTPLDFRQTDSKLRRGQNKDN